MKTHIVINDVCVCAIRATGVERQDCHRCEDIVTTALEHCAAALMRGKKTDRTKAIESLVRLGFIEDSHQ